MGAEVYHTLKGLIKAKYGQVRAAMSCQNMHRPEYVHIRLSGPGIIAHNRIA